MSQAENSARLPIELHDTGHIHDYMAELIPLVEQQLASDVSAVVDEAASLIKAEPLLVGYQTGCDIDLSKYLYRGKKGLVVLNAGVVIFPVPGTHEPYFNFEVGPVVGYRAEFNLGTNEPLGFRHIHLARNDMPRGLAHAAQHFIDGKDMNTLPKSVFGRGARWLRNR